MKLSKRMLLRASGITAAGTLAVTGITGAAAQPSQQFVSISIMQTNPHNGVPSSVIVRGAINDGGIDRGGNRVDTFVLSQGTIKVAHSNGTGTPHFNAKTCIGTSAVNGTYKIVGGTGKYAGISGHGIYRLNITTVGPRSASGTCAAGSNVLPIAFQQVIKATGPVSR